MFWYYILTINKIASCEKIKIPKNVSIPDLEMARVCNDEGELPN